MAFPATSLTIQINYAANEINAFIFAVKSF